LAILLVVAALPAAASADANRTTKAQAPGTLAIVLSKGRFTLVVISPGHAPRRLAQGGNIADPAWSPDGKEIVFSWTRRRAHPAQLYLITVATGAVRQLTHAHDSSIQPAWAPSGRRIAFVRVSGGPTHIYVLDVSSGRVRRLISGKPSDVAPAFSPNGRLIAFTRLLSSAGDGDEPTFNNAIYVARANGSRPRRLTATNGDSLDPTWGPKGGFIAYSAASGINSRIWIMRPDGSGKRPVTDGPLDAEPSWSPNGRSIAFTHRMRGRATVDVVSLVSGRAYSITEGLGPASSPSWR
jgi:TolB protein